MNCYTPSKQADHNYKTKEMKPRAYSGAFYPHTFSAFWLRSSVVSVLISLISDRPRGSTRASEPRVTGCPAIALPAGAAHPVSFSEQFQWKSKACNVNISFRTLSPDSVVVGTCSTAAVVLEKTRTVEVLWPYLVVAGFLLLFFLLVWWTLVPQKSKQILV